MPKWEYIVGRYWFIHQPDEDLDEEYVSVKFQDFLDKYGQYGWEVVDIRRFTISDVDYHYRCQDGRTRYSSTGVKDIRIVTFKRPLADQPEKSGPKIKSKSKAGKA